MQLLTSALADARTPVCVGFDFYSCHLSAHPFWPATGLKTVPSHPSVHPRHHFPSTRFHPLT
eukprot:6274345-Alexandrium_andersonii.AAC.1